jgi:hypothetical protein
MQGKIKAMRSISIVLILAALLLVNVPAMSGMADTFTATRTLPAANLHPGDTFDVTVSFSAPDDFFNAIGVTDIAPAGWQVSTNTAWCTPAAMFGNNPETNKAEYSWFGPYASGVSFSVVYKVTVPDDVSGGVYNFTGGQVEYYLSGDGPHFAATASNIEVTVAVTSGGVDSSGGPAGTGITSPGGYINTTEGESGIDDSDNPDIDNESSGEFTFKEPEPEGMVAAVTLPAAPDMESTPSLPTIEEPESPLDSQIPAPPSSGAGWWSIAIGIPVVLVGGLALAFLLVRKYKMSRLNKH